MSGALLMNPVPATVHFLGGCPSGGVVADPSVCAHECTLRRTEENVIVSSCPIESPPDADREALLAKIAHLEDTVESLRALLFRPPSLPPLPPSPPPPFR